MSALLHALIPVLQFLAAWTVEAFALGMVLGPIIKRCSAAYPIAPDEDA